MSRKAVTDGGKRDEIINAALELFFEQGYEGTSVRSIMKKAGAEIGLFYYYFNSKDEVFDIAVERFVESYRPGFDDAYSKGVVDPHQALSIYFEFVRRCTVEFRAKYGETLHWAVRRAIRERALEIMEPYLEKIIGLLVESGMQEPPVDRHVLAIILTNGVGSVILHADAVDWLAALPEMKKAVHLMLGSPEGAQIGLSETESTVGPAANQEDCP